MIDVLCFLYGVFAFIAGYSLGMWRASIWRKLFYRADHGWQRAIENTDDALRLVRELRGECDPKDHLDRLN